MIEYLLTNEERIRKEGWFRLDSLLPDPTLGASDPVHRKARCHEALRNLKPGVHMLVLHPAVLCDGTRAATGTAVQRGLDYRIFPDPETVRLFRALGIELVGWKDVAGTGRQRAGASCRHGRSEVVDRHPQPFVQSHARVPAEHASRFRDIGAPPGITASSRPTVDTKYPRAQECWPTRFRFRSPYTHAT